MIVHVFIIGLNGTGHAVFDAWEWQYVPPVTRCLEIHKRLRNVTGGMPFTIKEVKHVANL